MKQTLCNTVEEEEEEKAGQSSLAAQQWESATCHCRSHRDERLRKLLKHVQRDSKQKAQLINKQYNRLDIIADQKKYRKIDHRRMV